MTEDRRSNDTQRRIDEAVTRTHATTEDQIGIVATVGGEPLVMEIFGSPDLAEAHTPDMIRAIAFDVDGYDPFPSTPEQILNFLDIVRDVTFQRTPRESGTTSISGSHQHIDLRGIWSKDRQYIHAIALNRAHPVLQGA